MAYILTEKKNYRFKSLTTVQYSTSRNGRQYIQPSKSSSFEMATSRDYKERSLSPTPCSLSFRQFQTIDGKHRTITSMNTFNRIY